MESAAGALQQQLVQQQLLLQQLMAQKQTQMQMAQAPQLAAQSKKARECYVGNLTIGVVNEVVLRDFFNTAMKGMIPEEANTPVPAPPFRSLIYRSVFTNTNEFPTLART